MVYMDEWEYSLWLQIHRKELLAMNQEGDGSPSGEELEAPVFSESE